MSGAPQPECRIEITQKAIDAGVRTLLDRLEGSGALSSSTVCEVYVYAVLQSVLGELPVSVSWPAGNFLDL